MKLLRRLLFNSVTLPGVVAFVLMISSFSVTAQGVLSGARTQTGTIQAESQDDGFLVISGQRYGYDNTLTLVFLNNEQVDGEILDEGLVVRYTTDGNGVLIRVDVLGPANLIQSIDDN